MAQSGTANDEPAGAPRVSVLALDRWGSILVLEQGGAGAPPAGAARAEESADAAALRIFEEATGALLEDLRLFRTGERGHHVYYDDPDLALDALAPAAGASLRYVAPQEIAAAPLEDGARALLARFAASSAYRAMFH